jgi:hypothetical protein
LPVYGSHSRAVLSQLVVASRRPSGLNATPTTHLAWPVRVRARCDSGNRAGPGSADAAEAAGGTVGVGGSAAGAG